VSLESGQTDDFDKLDELLFLLCLSPRALHFPFSCILELKILTVSGVGPCCRSSAPASSRVRLLSVRPTSEDLHCQLYNRLTSNEKDLTIMSLVRDAGGVSVYSWSQNLLYILSSMLWRIPPLMCRSSNEAHLMYHP